MPCPKNTPVVEVVFGKIFGEYRSINSIERMNIIIPGEFPIDRFDLFLVKKDINTILFYQYSFLGFKRS
jgi:hypothetical protein